jgi:predicted acylesterase/phospholipase RssA
MVDKQTKVGYNTLGDLYLPTYLSVMNQTSGDTLRLYSKDPVHSKLDLLEVLLASTALPIAFRPRYITGFGDTPFIDGGTGVKLYFFSFLLDLDVLMRKQTKESTQFQHLLFWRTNQ